MRGSTWWVVTVMMPASTALWCTSTVSAQDPPPPPVGMTILEDDLSGPTLIRPSTCPNQRASNDYVGEGLRLKTTGPCRDGEIIAGMLAVIRGLTMLDGEVRIESKAVSGIDRQRIGLDARVQPVRPGG